MCQIKLVVVVVDFFYLKKSQVEIFGGVSEPEPGDGPWNRL